MRDTNEQHVPLVGQRWLWLWLPLGLAILPYAVHAVRPEVYDRWIRTETGLVETLTAVFLAIAVGVGVSLLYARGAQRPRGWARATVGVLTLGCFYFLGEEISWGQHYFHWRTPEAFAAHNEQGETNLHNLGGWTEALLDQGPRGLLTWAAAIGGVLIPAFGVKARGGALGTWLWPTMVLLPSALLANVASVPQKIAKAFGEVPFLLDIRGGESKELFLAMLLMLYLVTLRARRAELAGPSFVGAAPPAPGSSAR